MVTEPRTLNKKRYAFAAILTILIFTLGIMLGLIIEGKRFDLSQQRITEQRLDLSSLQLQYAYINQLTQEKNCPALTVSFNDNVNTLEQSRERLENYHKSASINKADFNLIKREYLIAQLNYWLLAKKYAQLCNASVTTILFFYDNEEDCNKCNDQGFILSYLKNTFKEQLLNFAIHGKQEQEPMVNILKDTHQINTYPTLIIQNQKIEGFINKEQLQKKICQNLNNHHPKCNDAENTT